MIRKLPLRKMLETIFFYSEKDKTEKAHHENPPAAEKTRKYFRDTILQAAFFFQVLEKQHAHHCEAFHIDEFFGPFFK